jgi:hypothetical protein
MIKNFKNNLLIKILAVFIATALWWYVKYGIK